jgi:hypothetical protein
VVPAQWKSIPRVVSVVRVDVVEEANCIPDSGDVDCLAAELRLGEEPDGQREWRGDLQFSQRVRLMIGAPPPDQ